MSRPETTQLQSPLETPLEPPRQGIVGLLYLPGHGSSSRLGVHIRWRRHVLANAALRNRSYMEALFRQRFPGGEILEISDRVVPQKALHASILVLLFPDSIGLDFGWIDRQLSKDGSAGRVLALNGRGRIFALDPVMRRRLRLRRLLEWTRLPEFVFFAFFVVVTAALLCVDLVKRHR